MDTEERKKHGIWWDVRRITGGNWEEWERG